VVGPNPGRAAVGMGVGDRLLARDHAPIGKADLDAAAERTLAGIALMVARVPLRILDGADLAPQRHARGTRGALTRVARLVMPGAILERDGEDVHERMVERLAT